MRNGQYQIPPRFLSFGEVITIHKDQLSRYGGKEGIRDIALLKSALAISSANFGGEYLHPTIPEMASAILFHLVKNHPFIDGNKRVGAASALVFLYLNNQDFNVDNDELFQWVSAVAGGSLIKNDLTLIFQERVYPD